MSTNGWVILGLILWAVVETMREYRLEPGRPLIMASGTVCLVIAFLVHRGVFD